jgi:hypothetical protein
MTRFYLPILLITVAFSSCVKEYVPANSSFKQLAFVSAEIEMGTFRPVIKVETTFDDINQPLEFDESINVDAYVEGIQSPIQFRQVLGNKSEWIAPPELDLQAGGTYKLKIDAREFGIPVCEAVSTIPHAGSFSVNSMILDNASEQFQIDLNLGIPPESESYYHVVPYIIDNNNEVHYLEIDEINTGANASIVLSHRYGMLIDHKILSEDMELGFLASILSSTIEPGNLDRPYLYIKLKTVTEDYYLYHKSLSRQAEVNQSPFTLPTITYTNFENGYGLFAVYSSKLDSIRIE